MKLKSFFCSLFLLSFLISNSQDIIRDYNSRDIEAALKLIGIEIFKFDFGASENGFNLIIYLDEIAYDSIISNQTFSFGQWRNDLTEKELKIIPKITNYNDSVYWCNIIHPNAHILLRFDISEEFRRAHHWMIIEQDEIIYDKKTPLLFYGMAWEDYFNDQKIMRFCWGENITRGMDNVSLKNIDHMVLISYELRSMTK